jgi:hypothetical protein
MAAKIGCANPQTATELIAREAVDCDFGSGSVRLLTFNDNSGRDEWVAAAKKLAGGVYAEGDRWVAQVDTTAVAQQIADKLGGKVV